MLDNFYFILVFVVILFDKSKFLIFVELRGFEIKKNI